MFPVYFQGVDQGRYSTAITILRQVILLVPLAWLLHFWELSAVWLTFPLTEVLTAAAALLLFRKTRQ